MLRFPEGTSTPWSYALIRLLFRFVLKIFYGSIVVEGTHNIPKSGRPCIVSANHSNSLTDALHDRNMLRLTAKATQFGRRTFTSWLIESAGTVPLKRRKDYADPEGVDNTEVMGKLMEALELGDAICLFPEGMSRYHPTIAPLKTGVARIISDVLTRNRHNPEFEICLLNCSVTYMHRQHFRSDVLVTFHPPLTFSPKTHPELLTPVDYMNIRSLTAQIYNQISSGTFDSPSWDLVRVGKLAARIYAPLGTRMTLGDHVRVVRTFLEAFKAAAEDHPDDEEKTAAETAELAQLRIDLRFFSDLARWGIKDDRIRRQPLPRRVILYRMLVRLAWSLCLFSISMPGLLLWLPTGPIFDTWDEIAQYKLIYGLISGLCVWFTLMWMTLRWLEDAVSAFRAFTSLVRLLLVGKPTLRSMHVRREDLHTRVMRLAVQTLGLPEDPEAYFVRHGGKEKGRVRGRWESGSRYFSIKRRRKRDWNETLRLYDIVDYPKEE
ncbi:hypothetical protein B0H13DRAFT_2229900 [Mycena leptocephala]|nr:hypothetical protein B0H13DRAFT_2229900 [Mycena leptocephala]